MAQEETEVHWSPLHAFVHWAMDEVQFCPEQRGWSSFGKRNFLRGLGFRKASHYSLQVNHGWRWQLMAMNLKVGLLCGQFTDLYLFANLSKDCQWWKQTLFAQTCMCISLLACPSSTRNWSWKYFRSPEISVLPWARCICWRVFLWTARSFADKAFCTGSKIQTAICSFWRSSAFRLLVWKMQHFLLELSPQSYFCLGLNIKRKKNYQHDKHQNVLTDQACVTCPLQMMSWSKVASHTQQNTLSPRRHTACFFTKCFDGSLEAKPSVLMPYILVSFCNLIWQPREQIGILSQV